MIELTELDAAILRELQNDARPTNRAIAIRIRPPSRENIEGFRDWAHRLPETVGVVVVSGGDDFLLHVAVPNTDAPYGLVIDRLTERPEVADVNTSVVYEHLRNFIIQPL